MEGKIGTAALHWARELDTSDSARGRMTAGESTARAGGVERVSLQYVGVLELKQCPRMGLQVGDSIEKLVALGIMTIQVCDPNDLNDLLSSNPPDVHWARSGCMYPSSSRGQGWQGRPQV